LHNHPSIGVVLKKLNLWIINDIIWFKPNAPPLIQKNRFVPSTELIWVSGKSKQYYFNYEMAVRLNNGKQMRNLWEIPAERHKTPHPTEKPEKLLERIILIGSKEGDVILDPFMVSGTTGVAPFPHTPARGRVWENQPSTRGMEQPGCPIPSVRKGGRSAACHPDNRRRPRTAAQVPGTAHRFP
jgi:DNA modification methylase